MKVAFWFLAAVIVGLLVVTISETRKLQEAYLELDKASARQAAVQSRLWELKQQQLASAQSVESTPAPAQP